MRKTRTRTRTSRPRLPKVDPEMRRWCARLGAELSSWPSVTSRPMFGLDAYYRGARIFAALPRTRAVDTPFSLLIKLGHVSDDRLRRGDGPGGAWATFAMECESDYAEALQRLGRAYRNARRPGR